MDQGLERSLCLPEVSKGHMSGFSSLMVLDATHRKLLTQLLPWLPVVPPPKTQTVFLSVLQSKYETLCVFSSYRFSKECSCTEPLYFLTHSGTLGIRPRCLSKGTSVVQKIMIVQFIICRGFCSPLHKFLSGIIWELKVFVNTRPSLKTFFSTKAIDGAAAVIKRRFG